MTLTTWDYQPNAVRIDGFGPFPCLLDTAQRWNGWQCPIFPLDSVKAITLTLDQAQDKSDNHFITFTDDGIWIHNPNYADEYEDTRGERAVEITVNGQTYYSIDNGWCWEETQVDCGDCGELFPYSQIVDLTRVGFDPCFVWVCKECEKNG